MKNKEHRMIYVADENLYIKIREIKKKYHLNISSLIRGFLEQKYSELKQNENNQVK